MIKGKLSFYCRMLGVSRQGFYKYLAHKDRPWKYQDLADAMRAINTEDECNEDHGQIENTFSGMNVRNVCDPLLVWMRSSSFSILSRWMVYACSATRSLGSASLPGLPFFRGGIPALSLRCRSLYRDIQLWICEYSRPGLWAISRLVIPSLFN